MRDLDRLDREIQALAEQVRPTQRQVSYNQLSESEAQVVVVLARASREVNHRTPILRPSWREDGRAVTATVAKVRELVELHQAGEIDVSPDQSLAAWLAETYPQHVDQDALEARNV